MKNIKHTLIIIGLLGLCFGAYQYSHSSHKQLPGQDKSIASHQSTAANKDLGTIGSELTTQPSNLDYKGIAGKIATAYNHYATTGKFNPLEHHTLAAKIAATVANKDDKLDSTTANAINMHWATAENLQRYLSIDNNGKLKLVESGTAEVTGPTLPTNKVL